MKQALRLRPRDKQALGLYRTLWALAGLGDPEELLTVAEVAPLLRVCKATVYRMVKDGSLPAAHVLNGVRIRRSALAGFATLAS